MPQPLYTPDASRLPPVSGLPGVVESFGLCAAGGGVGEVDEGLPRQFRHAGVGMPEQEDQHPYPAELAGFDPYDGDGLGHVEGSQVTFRLGWGILERPRAVRRFTIPALGTIRLL